MDYFYKCDKCGNDYHEMRNADEPQWFVNCACGGVNVEIVTDTATEVIDETTPE